MRKQSLRPFPGGKALAVRAFSLVELLVSLSVMIVLLGSVFTITLETSNLVGDVDVDHAAQTEATRGFSRLAEVLRKTGWNTVDGITYPRTMNGGKELEFRVPRDLDQNGYAFSASTGAVEWGPEIYRVGADDAGDLQIFRGTEPVWFLSRHATEISFATYLQDSALQFREIAVLLRTRKLTRRGEPLEFSVSGTIDMRN